MKRKKRTISITKLQEEEYTSEDILLKKKTPQMQDEVSFAGHMPDVESDGNVLDNEHAMGLSLNSDEEHPKPLNIASDIDKAEEYQRTH